VGITHGSSKMPVMNGLAAHHVVPRKRHGMHDDELHDDRRPTVKAAL